MDNPGLQWKGSYATDVASAKKGLRIVKSSCMNFKKRQRVFHCLKWFKRSRAELENGENAEELYALVDSIPPDTSFTFAANN